MSLSVLDRFGDNFSYNSNGKKITFDLNDFTETGSGIPARFCLDNSLASFGSTFSEKNARQFIWAILLRSYYKQPENADEDPEHPMIISTISPQIVDRSGSLSREYSLSISTYDVISNQNQIVSPNQVT